MQLKWIQAIRCERTKKATRLRRELESRREEKLTPHTEYFNQYLNKSKEMVKNATNEKIKEEQHQGREEGEFYTKFKERKQI